MSEVIGTAKIVAEVDSSGVEVGVNKAKRSLVDLGVTASTAGKKASDGINEMGKGGDQAAQKVDSATKNMIGSIQRATAAMQAGSKSGSEYYKVLASQRGIDVAALKPYLDQLDAVTPKQVNAGISAAQMSAALRGVPAQFTDIAVSLQAGQKPLSVFLQQGGQLKDMFGGVGPAAKALGGYVASLINPFTLAALGAGALAYAYNQGSKESDAYAKALILSGNAAGTTTGHLQEMAQHIYKVSGTQAEAAAALAQFAASSDISGKSFERFAMIAVRAEELTGQAVKETVKQFEELGKSPVEASIKLNETTNYLTASIYQQIKALEDQGKTADAAALAQKTYADELEIRLKQVDGRLGLIERGWKGITGAAKEAWDSMLNVGREQAPADKLSSLSNSIAQSREKIDRLSRLGPGKDNQIAISSEQSRLNALLQQQYYLQENARLEDKLAASQKASADQAKARIAFDKDGAQFLTNQAKMAREITKARNEGLAAGASQLEIDKRIADITAKYKDRGAISAGIQIDKAKLGADIGAIQKANEQLVASYASSEKVVDALHSARMISDAQYYEAKREFINLESQAEEDALKKEIARYQQERLSGKDKIDNDKKIADAEAKLAIVRANASSKLQLNGVQEAAANAKIARSYEDARQAAQAYIETITRQNAADIAGIGKGAEFRTNQAGRNKIEDKFTTQRQGLERDKRNGLIDQDQFDTYLKIASDTYTKELQAYEDRNKGIKAAQGDWLSGASEAFANYQTNAENVAGQSAAAFTGAFDGLTDGFASSVSKALVYGQSLEDGLKNVALNVADAFIASFIKIQIQKLFIDKTAATSYAGTIAAQSQAMVAMAGLNAFASTAAIPIVGPVLAPGAAAAATAIAEGFAAASIASATASIASARNGYDIPAGVNPITQLHEEEMVLPKQQANVIRDMAKNGGDSGKSGAITIINQTSANIGKVTERRLSNGDRALIIEEAVAATAAQLGDPNSRTSRSMSRNFSVQRSR